MDTVHILWLGGYLPGKGSLYKPACGTFDPPCTGVQPGCDNYIIICNMQLTGHDMMKDERESTAYIVI